MLTISGVHAFYGNIEALKGVDLEVRAGEIVALIGANGAGKSTLLMTICGRPRAARGQILFEGREITRLATFEIVRLGIAQAPEGRRIFSRMTVLENLQVGATIANRTSFDNELARVFTLFPILDQRRGQSGGTLSGGEQQMLAIARALMSRPRLLLLDEPSLGLAPLMVKQIFGAIREINERQKTTVLLVEQNAHQALRLADRGYVIQTGRIMLSGTGTELLANPEVRSAYLRRRAAVTALLGGEIGPFFTMTVVLFGGAAFLTGQAVAQSWRPGWQILPAALLLAAADRFFLYALFAAELASLSGFLIAAAMLGAILLAAYYLTRARKMVQQYPWLYERRGPFGWREKQPRRT